METKNIREANVVYAKDIPEYGPIYAYRDDSPKGQKDVVICYKLSFLERLMVLLKGELWVNVTTKTGQLLPMRVSVVKSHMITSRKQRRDRDKLKNNLIKASAKHKKKLHIPGPGEKGMTTSN